MLFVLALGFGACLTGVAVAEDLVSVMIGRFRVVPIAGLPVLIGRADAAVI